MNTDTTASVLAVALGLAADRAFGDPRRGHPVAAFGSVAAALEKRTYSDDRRAGIAHTALLLAGVTGAALAAEAATREHRVATVVLRATCVWAAVGGTTLARTGLAMAGAIDADDLPAARAILPSLCGRDPSQLDADGMVRAALESVAENTSDATVGVLLWTAFLGAPGAVAYRAINTLDAMIGYRSEKYRNFGWCAARVDDVANVLPARLTGVLTVAAAPLVGGRPGESLRAWRNDASKHPSPNAGVAEAAAAGALGVRLGGTTVYRHGVEIRPTLGDGRSPTTDDLRRAVRLSVAVQLGAAAAAAVAAMSVRSAFGLRQRLLP